MRKVDGWQTLTKPIAQPFALAALTGYINPAWRPRSLIPTQPDVARKNTNFPNEFRSDNVLSQIRTIIGNIPGLGRIAKLLYRRFKLQTNGLIFRTSAQYWNDRYGSGGNSGAGSYKRLAQFKAEVLNNFVAEHNIKSLVEWGCGDGAQLALAQYPQYVGYDVSGEAIAMCQSRYVRDTTKEFRIVGDPRPISAELSLSLDVIYHLVEDDVFDRYMCSLFDSATRFVIVYSSDEDNLWGADHVRHRQFTRWVKQNRPDWRLLERIPNRYPFDPNDQENTSFADFFVFAR